MTRLNSSSMHSLDFEMDRIFHPRCRLNKTLRELDVPNVTYNTLCIEYLEIAIAFEIKYIFIHLFVVKV